MTWTAYLFEKCKHVVLEISSPWMKETCGFLMYYHIKIFFCRLQGQKNVKILYKNLELTQFTKLFSVYNLENC